jgi:8-oxo-dGTP pyrophosphatase MutT (NUDIX family)
VGKGEALHIEAMEFARQVAALPVRRNPDGSLSVLLVTSRETRRWVIPKGWPWPDRDDYVAATEEAREEAGVLGLALPKKHWLLHLPKAPSSRANRYLHLRLSIGGTDNFLRGLPLWCTPLHLYG